MRIQVTVNGTAHESEVEDRTLLVHYIRDGLGLTGTNIGCDTSSCGSCTLHVDGESVKSCTMLAAQADGTSITTIEGLQLLDDVPGLGEVRRKTLLKHFGSLKKLRAATIDELALVPGIGHRTATAIKEAVEQQPARGQVRAVNTATGEIEDD